MVKMACRTGWRVRGSLGRGMVWHELAPRRKHPDMLRIHRAAPSDVFVLDLGGVLCDTAQDSLYPGVAEAVQYCEAPFYIVTSAPAEQASKLLQEKLGLRIPQGSSQLFANLDPSSMQKGEALSSNSLLLANLHIARENPSITQLEEALGCCRTIGSRPLCKDSGARLHYVDDQLSILEHLSDMEHAKAWNMYLANWGDSTKNDHKRASEQDITVLRVADFCELLKWGILMGVDDGCEPTPEEVQAQVFKKPSH